MTKPAPGGSLLERAAEVYDFNAYLRPAAPAVVAPSAPVPVDPTLAAIPAEFLASLAPRLNRAMAPRVSLAFDGALLLHTLPNDRLADRSRREAATLIVCRSSHNRGGARIDVRHDRHRGHHPRSRAVRLGAGCRAGPDHARGDGRLGLRSRNRARRRACRETLAR